MTTEFESSGPPLEVIHFASATELADKASQEWWARLHEAAHRGRCLNVALSGGRIAKDFLGSFVKTAQAHGSQAELRRLRFFWADERCVGPRDPESNYRLAEECLFKPLEISGEQIVRIQGELDPVEAAAQADNDLKRAISAPDDILPELDLVFLGMGEDGHVASLFPDAPEAASGSSVAYQAVVGPKPPPHRITLTYAALRAAREVWVLASGQGKEGALRESLASVSTTPLGRVLHARPFSRLFTDIQFTASGD